MKTKTFISEYIVFALLAIAMVGVFLAFKVLNLPDVEFKGVSCFLTLFEVLLFAYGFAWAMSCYHFHNVKKLCRKLTTGLFLAMLSVALTACSTFDSKPIEPKIIGTGNLQYEAKSGTWFVVVDSTQYTVANVTVRNPDKYAFSTTQNIEPIEGMLVTIFTSPRINGVQAVTDKKSIEQIEAVYHSSASTIGIILAFCIVFGLVLLCLKAIATPRTKKIPVVNADV